MLWQESRLPERVSAASVTAWNARPSSPDIPTSPELTRLAQYDMSSKRYHYSDQRVRIHSRNRYYGFWNRFSEALNGQGRDLQFGAHQPISFRSKGPRPGG